MFYKMSSEESRFGSLDTNWEKFYDQMKAFLSRLRLNVRIRVDGFMNTPWFPESNDGITCNATMLGVRNLGVANRDEYVFPHYRFAEKDDEITGACSGILRLGKKGSQTVLWCPRCCSIVRQPSEGSQDDAFLKTLGVLPS